MSRKLNGKESELATTRRECLAVVWIALQLRPNLEGAWLTVRTDHEAFEWLLSVSDASGKLARWKLQFFGFEFDIVHRANIRHQAADGLLRLPTDGTDNTKLDDHISVLAVTTNTANTDETKQKREGRETYKEPTEGN